MDRNNFYALCEPVFQPELLGKMTPQKELGHYPHLYPTMGKPNDYTCQFVLNVQRMNSGLLDYCYRDSRRASVAPTATRCRKQFGIKTMMSKLIGAVLCTIACSSPAAMAATQRDNDVFFAVTGVQSFSFQDSEHSIHSDQPWGGVSSNVTHPGAEAHILIKAGRKGSKSVAQWFKDRVGGGQTLVCDSKGNFPDELNFAARGTMRFSIAGRDFVCPDILIGQVHFASANNWWMGGPKMQGAHASFSGGTTQICSIQGQPLPAAVVFTPQTPCSNHFNIGVLQVR